MASWGSTEQRSYRDTSPTSPLSPLTPSSIPQWLRPSRSRPGGRANDRLKVFLLASACLALGWMFTSMLGPGDDILDATQVTYDTSSAGVLDDPSGFGAHKVTDKRPGIIGFGDDPEDAQESKKKLDEPSVSGALAVLHNAVSHKIQNWNPYFVKGPKAGKPSFFNDTTSPSTSRFNATAAWSGEVVKDGVSDEERLGARTRIGKVTLLFSGNNFWERCIRTHERHDKIHGYRLHVLRQQLMDDVWSKPAYILSLLLREMSKPTSERLEWLFWVDADTIILNPNVPIETFLPPPGTEFDDVYMMYSNDWNGLNNGVFPIRVNEWAVRMFSGIVAYRHFKPEDPLQFRDQSAMNALMQEPEFAKHVVQAPQRWFNAYQGEHNETLQAFQVRRGDLLVHFAGVGQREERMQYWLERAEQHLDDWEVPVKSTSYPQEAKDFWQEQKGKRKHLKKKIEVTRQKVQDMLTQIDERLIDYGDRLNDEDRTKIGQAREELNKIFNTEALTKEDVAKLEQAMKKLTEASTALTSAVSDSNRLLLQSAHEAIFAGEKDLLGSGFNEGKTSPELEAISLAVQNLKSLVMVPQESWNRLHISAATNTLTEARAKLQEKIDHELTAKKLAAEQAKALAEAKLAAQMEVDELAAEVGGVESKESEPQVNVDDLVEDAVKAVEATVPEVAIPVLDPVVAEVPAAVIGVTVTAPGSIVFVTEAAVVPPVVEDGTF